MQRTLLYRGSKTGILVVTPRVGALTTTRLHRRVRLLSRRPTPREVSSIVGPGGKDFVASIARPGVIGPSVCLGGIVLITIRSSFILPTTLYRRRRVGWCTLVLTSNICRFNLVRVTVKPVDIIDPFLPGIESAMTRDPTG